MQEAVSDFETTHAPLDKTGKTANRSAAYHRNQQRPIGQRQEAFWKAYYYLWKRRGHMDDARYRAQGIPIGSGVTEAGCKVVVRQRLKVTGMKWKKEGGQVVLTLRAIWLSGVWADACEKPYRRESKSTIAH